MIPLHLKISGFLSYRASTELDFTRFDLACISGANGAGKSTLLDAITWALFGQARRRDEALINLQSDSAEVVFTFRYENADYRILRSLRRGKGGNLELQVRAPSDSGVADQGDSAWLPLTERTQRETQARIEQILRLDYETFINASFFLQGKADLFAQQSPSKRKEVLGSILGLDTWEDLKARTAERRRSSESQLATAVARIGEVEAELAEEPQRRQRLGELEAELSRLAATRKAQTAALNGLRQSQAVLEQQRTLLAQQTAALDGVRRDLESLDARLKDREAARVQIVQLTDNQGRIEADYAAWRQATLELERWEQVAGEFRDHQQQRLPMLEVITAERARLEQELAQLEARRVLLEQSRASADSLARELQQAEGARASADARARERISLQATLAAAREDLAAKTAENKNLKEKMEELKRRIDTLDASSGAACPLCGQALTPEHRGETLERLQADGRELGDRHRANTAQMQSLRETTTEMQRQLTAEVDSQDDLLKHSNAVAALTERLGVMQRELADWEGVGEKRWRFVTSALGAGDFAAADRGKLAAVDAELAALGYDATAHDAVRRSEADLRSAEQARGQLQAAIGALAPLENEIRSLRSQIKTRQDDMERQAALVAVTRKAFESLPAHDLDLAQAERDLFELQEQENRLNQELGAARQRVAILADLKARLADLQASRAVLAVDIGRHKTLEAAFGKDGVPALLIEQALPELEAHANDILDRLSDGSMSVHFETQAAYRDRKRDDLRETLDIRISDGAGQRPYEMYSGGEAFRVNFAIRLALSQVLAGRTGARLQTLVIDEGFGSQDAQGIQRLIETINVIRPDFAKILLISHLEELKDAFPTRIEVGKGESGSVLNVN